MIHARIQRDFTFQTAIHFEDKFIINLYEMTAQMEVLTDDAEEQNTAIERMLYFLSSQIENSVFVCDDEIDAIEKYRNAGIQTCVIPDEPYDQIVGMILINKCNAIMENRIVVEEIVFGSKLSNLIKFNIEADLAAVEFAGKHWYNNSNLATMDKSKKDKIVPLFDKGNDWAELELTWKEK